MRRWLIGGSIKIALALLIGLFLGSKVALAADLKSLESLFVTNFNTYYEPRFCGRNIARLVDEANRRQINMKGAYILKFEGAGFFETSGFYTRKNPNKREMLGYFHVVLVADNRVFDFDLYDPLVLDMKDYIRLQFSPPGDRLVLMGVPYIAREALKWWTVTRFEIDDVHQESRRTAGKKKISDYVDLDAVFQCPSRLPNRPCFNELPRAK